MGQGAKELGVYLHLGVFLTTGKELWPFYSSCLVNDLMLSEVREVIGRDMVGKPCYL